MSFWLKWSSILGPVGSQWRLKLRKQKGPEKSRPQDGTGAVKSLRAEPNEGDTGGGAPPPLGVRRFRKVRKIRRLEERKIIIFEERNKGTEERTTGSTRRPGGSADLYLHGFLKTVKKICVD